MPDSLSQGPDRTNRAMRRAKGRRITNADMRAWQARSIWDKLHPQPKEESKLKKRLFPKKKKDE